MDESVLADLEEKIGRLAVALKAREEENTVLQDHRQALLEETTRLHDEVLKLRRIKQEAVGRVRLMQDRLKELERHVEL